MATIVIQMGHVARTSGATGTMWEQQAVREIAGRLDPALRDRGHTVRVIGADDAVPASDVFVALHCDGSNDINRRGASVGYPDADGERLAKAWKRAHQRAGYSGGFHADNYTENLRRYYGFRKSRARFRFLAEHATTTCPADLGWLRANLDAVAGAHVAAIGEVCGHPVDTAARAHLAVDPTTAAVDVTAHPDGAIWTFTGDGRVLCEGTAKECGSLAGIRLNGPIVAGVLAEDRAGYWMVGADGGIFAFGSAPPIQPYTPLFHEYARGERRIVRACRHADGLLLLSNRGERYLLP
jgi:hypothetical protein